MSVADLIPTKLFHCFNDLSRFLFWSCKKKKKKCLGNSDEKADQIAWRNEDKTLGILKKNLELKHNVHNMFVITCKTLLSEQDISRKK